MKVALTGASGLIGRALTDALTARGDQVVALVRTPESAERVSRSHVEAQLWPDPTGSSPPAAALTGADAVVNLMGEPIAQRWTDSAKEKIRASRVLSTRRLVAALTELPDFRRPATLISGSAVGYYGSRGDETLTEAASPAEDFLGEVTTSWESEALAAAKLPRLRVAVVRTGVVLAKQGGALAQLLPPFRFGLGGPVAGGKQYMPWIHIDDEVGAILSCLDDPRCEGPLNLSAPSPVTNAEFSKTLGRVLHRPAIVPVPGVALRVMFGEMASVITGGQRAIPGRLEEWGYQFAFPELEPALRDLLSKS